jgi:hypothetical protein
VIERRRAFIEWMKTADFSRLVFIDETGCNLQLTPRYGWSVRGERLVDTRPAVRGKNLTVIGAIRQDRVLCHDKFEGALNSTRWFAFVDKVLCPVLYPGDTVVLDTLSVHKNADAIARVVGVDPKTVRSYVAAAEALGLAGLLDDDGLARLLRELRIDVVERPRGEAWRRCDEHRDAIKKWLADGVKLTKVRKLLERRGVFVPYPTLHRFAAEELEFGRGRHSVRVVDPPAGAGSPTHSRPARSRKSSLSPTFRTCTSPRPQAPRPFAFATPRCSNSCTPADCAPPNAAPSR